MNKFVSLPRNQAISSSRGVSLTALFQRDSTQGLSRNGSAGSGLDPEPIWHSFASTNEGNPQSRHRKSARGAAVGHKRVESTVRYLGIEVDDALSISEQVDV
jgi:hypothetical protein